MKLLALGKHYVSDFVVHDYDYGNRKKYSLDLELDESIGAAKLAEAAPKSDMWGKYWYRSGINRLMVSELHSIVNEVVDRVNLSPGDVWLDIACNDGTLLEAVPSYMVKLGIDPADDSYYQESSKRATKVVQDYFSFDAYVRTGYSQKAKVITTIAMFYDLENPHSFIDDVYKVLDDNGVWVVQVSYTPLMLQQLAFDNICHEHMYYYDLNSLCRLFAGHRFKVVDASLNDTNGASLRIYVQKTGASFGTGPLRDVCNYRVESILRYEKEHCDISNPRTWQKFYSNICELKEQTVSFIRSEKSKGKNIYGYGASTKGNTLLQWFGLDNTMIDGIAERSPCKYGLKTIGTNIPILSEADVRVKNPDYMLVLPWHFIKEFVSREHEYLSAGGRFIVPCPEFKVI